MSSQGSKRRKKKLSRGSKDNLTTIINDLSYIIGRKNILAEDPRDTITSAYNNIDTYIAGLSLSIPEVDSLWIESGSKDAFLKLKRKRQWLVRFLFGGTIAISVLLVAATLVAFILMDHWSKWIILASAVGIVLMGSLILPNSVIGPYIIKRDKELSSKYTKECQLIDNYINELLKIRK
ncbi:MAG TPA: hypothetical protein VMX55_09035 [candidate division Zixibacteria bacterium]|nr:hypothetical protein [candidate division Zixibacteria bacterium]